MVHRNSRGISFCPTMCSCYLEEGGQSLLMQEKSMSSVCDLGIDPQKDLNVLQAVGTIRAGRLDTKE